MIKIEARISQGGQLRREQRSPRLYAANVALIEPETLKRGLVRLSQERVEYILLAEASQDVAVLINAFRRNKVEHNDQSIAKLFGVDLLRAKAFAKTLMDIGLFEYTGEVYRIPILYRDGLEVTQGKAF